VALYLYSPSIPSRRRREQLYLYFADVQMDIDITCVISGFRREVAKNCALLGHYAVSGGNFLPTFGDKISVPSSGLLTSEMGQIGCPETSVRNYHCSLRDDPEERSSHRHYLFKGW